MESYKCARCAIDYFLSPDSKECININNLPATLGYALTTNPDKMVSCTSIGCRECNFTSTGQCTLCDEDLLMHPTLGVCLKEFICPSGYYKVDLLRVC